VDFDFPDVLDVEYGEDVELEDGTTVRMITNLDPNYEEIVTGKAESSNGKKLVSKKTVTTKGGEKKSGFIVEKDASGKVIGMTGGGNYKIDVKRVNKDALKDESAESKKLDVKPETKTTILQRLKKVITPGTKPKPSAIPGIPVGGLD
jgi:pyruvate kinase